MIPTETKRSVVFSSSAKDLLRGAAKIAIESKSHTLRTSHILLAMAKAPSDDSGYLALRRLGIDADQIIAAHDAIDWNDRVGENILGKREPTIRTDTLDPTTKFLLNSRAIEQAALYRKSMGGKSPFFLGSYDILVGLVREESNRKPDPGLDILTRLGVDIDSDILSQLMRQKPGLATRILTTFKFDQTYSDGQYILDGQPTPGAD